MKFRHKQAPGAVDLIEEALHLLREAPFGVWVLYYTGTVPFVLGFLYFWADMAQSAFAVQRAGGAALGMVLQELTANSLKYGALSRPAGRVELRWSVGPRSELHGQPFVLSWREIGGPPIEVAPKDGQGTGLIQGFVRTELRGRLELSYPTDGASHSFFLHLDPAV